MSPLIVEHVTSLRNISSCGSSLETPKWDVPHCEAPLLLVKEVKTLTTTLQLRQVYHLTSTFSSQTAPNSSWDYLKSPDVNNFLPLNLMHVILKTFFHVNSCQDLVNSAAYNRSAQLNFQESFKRKKTRCMVHFIPVNKKKCCLDVGPDCFQANISYSCPLQIMYVIFTCTWSMWK